MDFKTITTWKFIALSFSFIGQPISNKTYIIIKSEGMGNETSILEQCTIDESPILKSKYWLLHHGQRDEDHAQLSVFVSKQKRVRNDENILFQSAKVCQQWNEKMIAIKHELIYL